MAMYRLAPQLTSKRFWLSFVFVVIEMSTDPQRAQTENQTCVCFCCWWQVWGADLYQWWWFSEREKPKNGRMPIRVFPISHPRAQSRQGSGDTKKTARPLSQDGQYLSEDRTDSETPSFVKYFSESWEASSQPTFMWLFRGIIWCTFFFFLT